MPRVLLAVGALVLVLLIAAGATLTWLWRSDSGLQAVLQRVPGLVMLGVQGRPTGGPYAVQRLQWRGASLQIVIEGLAWDDATWRWRPHTGAWAGLALQGARAASVQVLRTPPPQPAPPPAAPPQSLQLPLALQAPGFRVGSVVIDTQQPLQDLAADVHLGAEAGTLHRIDNLEVRRAGLALQGGLTLGTAGTLPLNAQLTLATQDGAAQPWQATVQAQGPLQRLNATAQLQIVAAAAGGARAGAPAAAQAPAQATVQATLAPFAPWPLLALVAQTAQLDLSTLAPGWPKTSLSGQVRLVEPGAGADAGAAASPPGGANDVLTLEVELRNAAPAPLDAGGLPVAALQVLLKGRPAEPELLVFERLVLLQGNAGQALGETRGKVASSARDGGRGKGPGQARGEVRGKVPTPARAGAREGEPDAVPNPAPNPAPGEVRGEGRWQASTLNLTLQLSGLQPSQLHTAAPAMAFSGPLTLQLDGVAVPGSAPATTPAALIAALKADLQGRLPRRGAPPLSLQAEARATRQPDGTLQVALRQLRAAADGGRSGSAEATADLSSSSTGAWQLQTNGALRAFDPAPWWPAAAGGSAGDTAGTTGARGSNRIDGSWQADLSLIGPSLAASPRAPSVAPSAAPSAAPSTPRAAGARNGATPDATPLLDRLRGRAQLTLDDSRWAGLQWRGQAELNAGAQAANLSAELRAGDNRLQAKGTLGHGRNAVPIGQIELQAPALAGLAPLARLLPASAAAWWPAEGALVLNADVQGRWPALRSEGTLDARGLRSSAMAIGQADARWTLSTQSADAPLSLQLQARDLVRGAQRLDIVQASLQGSVAAHQLEISASSPVRPPAWAEAVAGAPGPVGSTFALAGSGQWTASATAPTAAPAPATAPAPTPAPATATATPGTGGTWQGRLTRLQAAARNAPGAPWLQAADLAVSVVHDAQGQPLRIEAQPGRVQALGGALSWQQAVWQAPAATAAAGAQPRLQLQARLEPLQVAPFLARLQPQFGWRGDLAVGGSARIDSGDRFTADVVLERTAGDLSLSIEGATRALEIGNLRFGLQARDGLWQFTQALVGRSVGIVGGLQTLTTSAQAVWPADDAPLTGGLSLQVPQLAVWAPWLPPGWRLGGNLRIAASFAGRAGAPEYRGDITGERLAVRNLFEGLQLQQGELAVALSGLQARIERFEFRDGAGDGRLSVTGDAAFGEAPRAQLRLVADKLRALDRFDRRITLSGAADLGLQAQRLALKGSFVIDEGLVDATQADAPKLSADVVVLNRAPLVVPGSGGAQPAAPRTAPTSTTAAAPPPPARSPLGTADVDLRIALGEALRLRGRGLDTLLRGDLRVTTPGGQLAVNGSVRAEQGSYRAYGQNLSIERGLLIFRGEVGNPQLDILALRADIDQRVGVVVSGSATNPRVRLYSEPELGQMDTLTWLVLGRAPEGLGRDDTALLQRAALALLAGERDGGGAGGIVQRLGLDELSLSRGGNGTNTAGDTIISLGKQISRRVYVGYEHALGTTGGTWQLIYRVAGRLTLRARTGAENAVDAIWTWRWD